MATNTYVALDKVTLGSSAASVTFSSINQGYTDLRLVISTTHSINPASVANLQIQFNGDTGSNYSFTRLLGDGSSATSSRSTNQTAGGIGYYSDDLSDFGVFTTDVMNYSNSTTYKTVISRGSAASVMVSAYTSLWRSTAAVTSILIKNSAGVNFKAGSTFSLYGIASASVGAKATGGTIYADDQYYYHVFGSTGTFTPLSSLTADYLVIAGGGGGGATTGGGGGAGGFYSTTSASLSATGYTVTVGAGGAGGTNNGSSGSAGSQGSTTSFNSISRTGGGGGSTSPNIPTYAATTGGSGGGGSRSGSSQPGAAGNAGGYSPVEGYAGGNNWNSGGVYGTGGGGGAGGVGQAGTSTYDGAGGIGATSALVTAIVNATGVGELVSSTGYITGGGGGASGDVASTTPTGALGGNGGGGKGGSSTTFPIAGKIATGSGGGGGGYFGGFNSGGNGGSGVVIVRYLKA